MTEEMKVSLTEKEGLLVRTLLALKNMECKNKIKRGGSYLWLEEEMLARIEVIEEKMQLAEKARYYAALEAEEAK